MKVVILAGGLGTRISEESHLVPKPMIELGNLPIIVHIMRYYSYFGFNEFIILAGYKQKVIKDYFNNYFLYSSDVTFDYSIGGNRTYHNSTSENWIVTVVDTGLDTMTGGRIKLAEKYIGDNDFHLTYGDGLADVNLVELVKQHQWREAIVTLTGIKDPPRFGNLEIEADKVINFKEKDSSDSSWINGGFMIVSKEIFSYIEGKDTVLEKHTLTKISKDRKLGVYKHLGFWQCMDTLRDKEQLENLIAKSNAPWMKSHEVK